MLDAPFMSGRYEAPESSPNRSLIFRSMVRLDLHFYASHLRGYVILRLKQKVCFAIKRRRKRGILFLAIAKFAPASIVA